MNHFQMSSKDGDQSKFQLIHEVSDLKFRNERLKYDKDDLEKKLTQEKIDFREMKKYYEDKLANMGPAGDHVDCDKKIAKLKKRLSEANVESLKTLKDLQDQFNELKTKNSKNEEKIKKLEAERDSLQAKMVEFDNYINEMEKNLAETSEDRDRKTETLKFFKKSCNALKTYHHGIRDCILTIEGKMNSEQRSKVKKAWGELKEDELELRKIIKELLNIASGRRAPRSEKDYESEKSSGKKKKKKSKKKKKKSKPKKSRRR